jgi:uncharacterized protein (TIGR00369 family)
MDRTREYSWEDPHALAAAARSMSGLEFLQAMQAGRLPVPPIAQTLGFTGFTAEPGRAVFTCTPGEYHYNPIGVVHGGLHATMLDSAAGCAVQTTLPAGTGYTSLDLAVRFLRPVTADSGPVRAIGTVLHRSRRTALAEAQLVDAADRLLAHATSTCLIFEITD